MDPGQVFSYVILYLTCIAPLLATVYPGPLEKHRVLGLLARPRNAVFARGLKLLLIPKWRSRTQMLAPEYRIMQSLPGQEAAPSAVRWCLKACQSLRRIGKPGITLDRQSVRLSGRCNPQATPLV